MKIVLATGIYPPEIGGPATYVRALAEEMTKRRVKVTVVTYAKMRKPRHHTGCGAPCRNASFDCAEDKEMRKWDVVRVSKSVPVVRWLRYARALKKRADDADAVIAFSSVSCGVPILMARLRKPKKVLRLGGDFFWERYTDRGGRQTLCGFYERSPVIYQYTSILISRILRAFDHIVFSTRFQEEIYERHCGRLPPHSVIENAVPEGEPLRHAKHEPLRLLYLGRLVGFKNLPNLIRAVGALHGAPIRRNVTLTIVGDGPKYPKLRSIVRTQLAPSSRSRIRFLPPAHSGEKRRLFADHDLLILPSLTEISPNVALEARAAGLPVLLTQETGLSTRLRDGMIIRDLSTPERIAAAVRGIMDGYVEVSAKAAGPLPERRWREVAEEWLALLRGGV